jgi:mono/diheme cytochrome c family protein
MSQERQADMHDAQGTSRRRVLLVAALCLAAAGSARAIAQGAGTPGRTVWDGVYTAAQAERATPIFSQSCANCHTLESDGNRPLSGDAFWKGYTQKSVGDLLAFVSANMPNGSGGSLPASTYNDLVALILASNGFPAGTTELAPETIADVQIVPKDGPGALPAGTLVRVVGCLARTGSEWVLTSATDPERIEKGGAGPDDASRSLGDRTTPLKFVVTRLDSFVGHRVSASGLLMGPGGEDGLNVTMVSGVAESCP